jgi:hypothetical protein
LGGFIFKARKAHFSDEQALLDFGKTPIGDICIIVPDSDYSLEYANRAILLEHCVKKSV